MRRVKFVLPLTLLIAFATTACNTIENRRSFYAPKKGDGPYTRSLRDGSWKKQKTVDEQYAEAKRDRKMGRKEATPAASAAPSAEIE